MTVPDDFGDAWRRVGQARGLRAWGAKHSVGSWISVEFGAAREGEPGRGSYGLFVYDTAWRWEDAEHILLSSDDPHDRLRAGVGRLDSLILAAVSVEFPSMSARFDFDDGSRLRTFTTRTRPDDDLQHWMMFLPDGQVFAAGPGGRWSIGPAGADNDRPGAGT